MANTRCVIFDYDGTLVDTAAAFVDSVNEAFRKKGLTSATRREVSSKDLRSMINGRLNDGSQLSTESVFDSIWSEFAQALSSPFPLRDGAAQTLETLANQGFGLALISKRGGKAGMLPLTELRMTGLDRLFRFMKVGVGLREYGEVISAAVAQVGMRHSDSVVVSDWGMDIQRAKSDGLRTIGITGGISDRDEFQTAGADWIIDRLAEIPPLLTLVS